VDAEKIMWRDVAALVALGHVDFAGIVHNHFSRRAWRRRPTLGE